MSLLIINASGQAFSAFSKTIAHIWAPPNGPVIQASLGVWPAPLHLSPCPGVTPETGARAPRLVLLGHWLCPHPAPRPASDLTSLSRSLQLMEALKEQEEINFRLRQYMDKIILAILDHNPSILEIKH